MKSEVSRIFFIIFNVKICYLILFSFCVRHKMSQLRVKVDVYLNEVFQYFLFSFMKSIYRVLPFIGIALD